MHFMKLPCEKPEGSYRSYTRDVKENNACFVDDEVDEAISSMVTRPLTIMEGTVVCEQIDGAFKKDPDLSHLVIIRGQEPRGLITRQYFYLQTGGPFGYQLFQRKPAEMICRKNPLLIRDQTPVMVLAELAMARSLDEMYDPVIVVDEKNCFLGTITMKQLIVRSMEIEVRHARGANPLTNLPGNLSIAKWIGQVVSAKDFTLIYADLDRFKEYNDVYGFVMGDELIRFTGIILEKNLKRLSGEARLGHVGGDDFVIVCRGPVSTDGLADLCQRFDAEKQVVFDPSDLTRGYIIAPDLSGRTVEVPLTTLSLAVIGSDKLPGEIHPAMLGQIAASLKKKVKAKTITTGCSDYIIERRRYG